MSVRKSKAEIPTIDCNLVTIAITTIVEEEPVTDEFGFETANKVAVEPQIEETDAVKLIVKGKLIAQKPKDATLTGHTITLTDNVFNPDLVVALQGGTIQYDTVDTTKIVGYTPPVAGSAPGGVEFTLNCYSAQYNAAGQIVQYEKISYPHCKGSPIALSSEDGVFRAPEYTINSAPNTGEAPYVISYVATLPTLVVPNT